MNYEFIKRLTDIVEANLADEKFGIEDVAREMGMSHSSLHRKLKTSSNQTISQFIREIRLKKAKDLLLNEDLTVSEISYRVGFGSPTYFNKCFHEYFGYPPGESKNHEFHGEPGKKPENTFLKKSRHTKILIVFIISLIVIIPLTILLIEKGSFSKSVNAKEKSIALLPFKYLSDEQGKQYLADGMMDAILLHLSKIKDLRVISRTSVEKYRKTSKTAEEIGRELDVAYLLEGSFLKDEDQARLIVQLIKTSDESHIWSNEYNRDWKTILSVQSEVAETIASELQAVITPEEHQLIRKLPTVNLTAYDFYQRGRDEFTKYENDNGNRAALGKARNLYHKALKSDSTFAAAYMGLAWIYWVKHYYETYFAANFMDSVLCLANTALKFDNHLAEGYFLRGLYYSNTGQSELGIKELDKAIIYDPNYGRAYDVRGDILIWVFDDIVGGISSFHESAKRDRSKQYPYTLKFLARAYLDAGFIDKSKLYYEQSLNLDGDSASYFFNLALVEVCLENFAKALGYVKKAYAADTNYIFDMPLYHSFIGLDKEAAIYAERYANKLQKSGNLELIRSHRIGYAFWRVGKIKEAKYYFDQQIKYGLESIKTSRYIARNKAAHYDLAAAYAFLGDKVKAYQYLDEWNKKHALGWWWVTFLKHDPLFTSIRQEPRFQQILKEMEAKYQAEHERVRKWLEEQKML